MTTTPQTTIVRNTVESRQAPPLAAWVEGLFGEGDAVHQVERRCVRRRAGFALVSVRVPDAVDLTASSLENETVVAYETIADQLREDDWHPVRFWNHVPHINEPMGDGRDRYMTFNAGRFRAFVNWYGSAHEFDRLVATASGIGHRGRDLVVHCLAMQQPGKAVDNPRQVAPYHYSRRFGPLPPAFARATVLKAADDLPGRILVGGTASVRGEDSVHVADLSQQLDETFENLAALVRAADGHMNGERPSRSSLLARYRDLRAYVPDESNFDAVASAISAAFPSLQRLELLRAELCRSELLVEIEGVAN
ncbi:MAG TPA: hypothetical protein VL282_16960 [Tepidisphaeraceae bacterium]|nr:hypothetical protein [Tepidisphaeraceae bacterium]